MLHTRTSKVLPFLVLASVLPTFAQTTTFGGRGIYRVLSARNIQAGSIVANSHYSALLRNDNTSKRKNHGGISIGLAYGIRDDLELTAQIIPYRHDQVDDLRGMGDTQLGLNWYLPLRVSQLDFGIRGFFWLPTADNRNAAYEPYSEDDVSWSISGIISSELGKENGKHAVRLDFNVGYLDHNIGTFLSGQSTDQLILGLGYKVPVSPVIYFGEYTAEIFMDNDFSAGQNSMRLTQGIRFRIPFGCFADAGLDYVLGENPISGESVGESAKWSIFLGISHHFVTRRVPVGPAYPDAAMISSKAPESYEQLERRKDLEKELKELRDELDTPVNDEEKAEKR